MGLYVQYYEKLSLLPADEDDSRAALERHWEAEDVKAHVLEGFEAAAGGLELDRWYASHGDEGGFSAGSYRGYNEWREKLAWLAAYEPHHAWDCPEEYADRPFFLLVNFADNEGVFGPDACAELAAQFDEWAEYAWRAWEHEPHALAVYEWFRHAFHVAAGEGAVEFR